MSETITNQGAICPGQKTLMDNGDKHFLRITFLCYRMNWLPSAEIFYMTDHQLRLNVSSIASFETQVLSLMHANGQTNAMNLIYMGYSGIEMSSKDIAAAGWHVIMGEINPDDA